MKNKNIRVGFICLRFFQHISRLQIFNVREYVQLTRLNLYFKSPYMPLFPFMFCKIVCMFGDSTGVAKGKKVIFYTVLFSINFITLVL
jgi:hypothetical protein